MRSPSQHALVATQLFLIVAGLSPSRSLAAEGTGTSSAAVGRSEQPGTSTSTSAVTSRPEAGHPRAPEAAEEVQAASSTRSSTIAAASTAPVIAPKQRILLSGYAQLDYQRLQLSSDQLADGTARSLNDDRFLVRRARLRATGDWDYLGFVTELNLSTVNGPEVGIRQLEGLVKIPGDSPGSAPLARLGAGVFEVPFGFEVYGQGNRDRLFTERSVMAQAFVPGEHDVGARLSGAYRWARWALAVQNGEPIGARAYPGADPNADKDFSARVGVDAEVTSGVRISGAVSVLEGSGFHPGTVPSKDGFVWRDFNEDGIVTLSELQTIQGSAATPSSSFRRWGFGADLQVRVLLPVVGELFAYGEIATASNLDRGVAPADPVFLGRDQRSFGFYVALTQELGEHAMIGARYDVYDPNADALDVQNGQTVLSRRTFKTLTLAAAGRLRFEGATGRIVLEGQLQENGLGRDSAGRPTTLANDGLRLRLEVGF